MAKFYYKQFSYSTPQISREQFEYLKKNENRPIPIFASRFSDEFEIELKMVYWGFGLGIPISFIVNNFDDLLNKFIGGLLAVIMTLSVIIGIMTSASILVSLPSYFKVQSQKAEFENRLKLAVRKSRTYEEFIRNL
jgi:hypothetical protein